MPRTTQLMLELLRSGETVRFRALGNSMWPSIPSGSRVEVSPCAASELAVGQVAAFERRGQLVVHRVHALSAEGLHFAGDALRREDGVIAREHVLGRASVVERRPLRLRWPTLGHLRLLCRAAYWRTCGPRLGPLLAKARPPS